MDNKNNQNIGLLPALFEPATSTLQRTEFTMFFDYYFINICLMGKFSAGCMAQRYALVAKLTLMELSVGKPLSITPFA